MRFNKTAFTLVFACILFSTACKKDCSCEASPNAEVNTPAQFPAYEAESGNTPTEAGIELGRRLFFDKRMSRDGETSCATCHRPQDAFASRGKKFDRRADGSMTTRNAPPLFNLSYMPHFFWDGRSSLLTEQVFEALNEENFLTQSILEQVIADDSTYADLFCSAFDNADPDLQLAAKAIAQFQSTIISGTSDFDRADFNEQEIRGLHIFNSEDGDCFHCHGGHTLTDNDFRNNGLDSVFTDLGREDVTMVDQDKGKFKTPSLRNLAFTAPYMHDGRFATLDEVLDFYSEGVVHSNYVDPLMKKSQAGGLQLSPEQKADLKAFLLTMTDSSMTQHPDYQNPF